MFPCCLKFNLSISSGLGVDPLDLRRLLTGRILDYTENARYSFYITFTDQMHRNSHDEDEEQFGWDNLSAELTKFKGNPDKKS